MRHMREANRTAVYEARVHWLEEMKRKEGKGRAEAFIEMREDCENYPF